jgi:hypothetical protein
VKLGAAADQAREEYVESALARRKRHAAEAAAQQEQREQEQERQRQQQQQHGIATSATSTTAEGVGPAADAQRVLQGRLLEIDLGEEARARNVAMTERARRRLQGQIDEEEKDDEGQGHRARKVRLGRDGRPLPPPRSGRNRRGSDDIKRDQLVEEFLSENRRRTSLSLFFYSLQLSLRVTWSTTR